MGAFLAELPHFALEAEETFDELPDGELRWQLTNVRRVAVERPNRLAADATGDTLNRASWYDGRTVTVLDKAHHVSLPADRAAVTVAGAPGNQVAVAAGTALEFRLARPLSVDILG